MCFSGEIWGRGWSATWPTVSEGEVRTPNHPPPQQTVPQQHEAQNCGAARASWEGIILYNITEKKIPEYQESLVVGTVKYTSMCEYGGLFHSLGSNINRCEAYDYGNEDTKPVECLYME